MNSCTQNSAKARPVLKWAGGKGQMLGVLEPLVPHSYGKYIEPFFGGGALFFAHQPRKAVISDANPELVNLYRTIRDDWEGISRLLETMPNEKSFFSEIRSKDWVSMGPVEAAARTIYLNRTAFNGLYRVNRKGQFNTPFGNYKNPRICDHENLCAVSHALRNAVIVEGDYLDVLFEHAGPTDFVFLDPPYVPLSSTSDFKRYTRSQFDESDQRRLAQEIERLVELGCHVVLTNSNHPLVHELYGKYDLRIHETRRSINSRGTGRRGEDVVVHIPAKARVVPAAARSSDSSSQEDLYPSTRYMGSKTKLLTQIKAVLQQFDCTTVADLFSGSGIVSYMFKAAGKQVLANDQMALGAIFTKAMVENSKATLSEEKARHLLTATDQPVDGFVTKTFEGLYFPDSTNHAIDRVRANIKGLADSNQIAIARAALARTCMKMRPRGIFTYVGHRYDDGRRDLKLGFDEHFMSAVRQVNEAVFDNGQLNRSCRGDAFEVPAGHDLVYLDPPYWSPHSDNNYVRRYHFVEGLCCDWEGCDIQWHTKTRKFAAYPTPFARRDTAYKAFEALFEKHRKSVIVVSYSSNSYPTLDEMVSMLRRYKAKVDVVEINHRYSFGNQGHRQDDNRNAVTEYLFVGY